MIYFDNAATSWPKPEAVYRSMDTFFREKGGNPGRGAHFWAREAAKEVAAVRKLLAELFNVSNPERITFTANITAALNTALKGILQSGDRVLISGMEHNAVVRPLYSLKQQGVDMKIITCSSSGLIDLQALQEQLNIKTRMICINHASNVCGALQPLREIAVMARENGALLVVDTAQTAGIMPIDAEKLGIDLLAFTGHKALFGPPGTGGIYVAPGIDVEPLITGGTGSRSDLREQPADYPEHLESGTLNTVGLAGLGAGLKFIQQTGMENIYAHEKMLTSDFINGLTAREGVAVYGPRDAGLQAPVVAFNIRGWKSEEAAYYLDSVHGIAVRGGLHCAPLAHRTLGTFPEGTVRASFGWSNTREEVRQALRAIDEMLN